MTFDQTRALPEPLLKAFIEKSHRYVGNRVAEGLPAEVYKCIAMYSADFYEINSKIRNFGMESISLTESIICKNIVAGLDALPLFTCNVYSVFRAITVENKEDALLFKDLMETDQPFVEQAFLSTTLMHIQSEGMDYFNGKNCYFAIFSKTGRHILQELTPNEELEVVFRPGTSFRILSFEDTKPNQEHGTGPDQAGRYRIVMEEIKM
jgi:hypothetical protein